MGRNFRKRSTPADDDDDDDDDDENKLSDDEQERRLALEEVKFLQKQRPRKSGIPALTSSAFDSESSLSITAEEKSKESNEENNGGGDGVDGENDDWALTRTFAEEADVPDEDPNMLSFIEIELAKKKGKKVEVPQEEVENELQRAEEELYKIP